MDIFRLLELAREYFLLEEGILIEHHGEMLKILEIDDSNSEHPHKQHKVYITRRALKHVVESRKKDLVKKHTHEQAEIMVVFVVEMIPLVIQDFDIYELEPVNKHFYTKDFSDKGMPSVRVLVEKDEEDIFIRSVHFAKRTKKHRG